jgi:hypothetical protein
MTAAFIRGKTVDSTLKLHASPQLPQSLKLHNFSTNLSLDLHLILKQNCLLITFIPHIPPKSRQGKKSAKTSEVKKTIASGGQQPHIHEHLHNMLLMLISLFLRANINNNNNNVSSRFSFVCTFCGGNFECPGQKSFSTNTHTHMAKILFIFHEKEKSLRMFFLAGFFPRLFSLMP